MILAAWLFVLGLTLAAAAGPVDGRQGVKAGAETAYGRVPGGVSLADSAELAPATPSSNGGEGAQGGDNPLWKIPLSALTATRERPLFSSSRRPPASVVRAITELPQAKDPTPVAPPPERPAMKLIGTVVSQTASVALLKDPATEAVTRLRAGQAASGWRVKTVELRSIVVEKGDQSVTLTLPKPGGTPTEQPPPDQPSNGERRIRRAEQ
jgi:general secretion pathway protein N